MRGGRRKLRRPRKHGRLAHDIKTDSSEEFPPQRFAASAPQGRLSCSHIQGRKGRAADRTVCRRFVGALLPYPLPGKYGGSHFHTPSPPPHTHHPPHCCSPCTQ